MKRNTRLLRFLIPAITILLLLTISAVVVINVAVLPKITHNLNKSFAQENNQSLAIGNVRYWPLRGLVVRNIAFSHDFAGGPARSITVRLEVGKIRIPWPEGVAIRWLRGPYIGAGPDTGIFSIAEHTADAGLLPQRILLKDAAMEICIEDVPPITSETEKVIVRHNTSLSAILVTTPDTHGDALSLKLHADYRNNTIAGGLQIDPLPLTFSPFTGGNAGLDLLIHYDDHQPLDVSGTVVMRDASLNIPEVADEPIENLDVEYRLEAIFKTADKTHVFSNRLRATAENPLIIKTNEEIAITKGTLNVNGIAIELQPTLYGTGGEPAVIGLTLLLPETEIQTIVHSIPIALAGNLSETKTDGTIAWDFKLLVPLIDISEMQWTSDVTLTNFAVRRIDPAVNVYKINEGFIHQIQDGSGGYYRSVRIPPAKPASMAWMLKHSEHTEAQIRRMREEDRQIAASRPPVQTDQAGDAGRPPITTEAATDPDYRYVYVDDMSPWIISSVLTAEDGDFFFYEGINPITFADAVELNIEEGGVVLGASTISMQLIKILFLDQQRIFARKLQEAFLVYLMVHHVPVSKERILELYLNLAEFGPGIYGVNDAADRYFNKPPSALTAGEATWLASILPSPKRYYRQFEEGLITPEGFRRIVALYDIMLERGRMSPEEYRQAIDAGPPEFGLQR